MSTSVVSRNRPAPVFQWLVLATDRLTPQGRTVAEFSLSVKAAYYNTTPQLTSRAMMVSYGSRGPALYVTFKDDFYVGRSIEKLLPKHLGFLNTLLPPIMMLADVDTHYALLVSKPHERDPEREERVEFTLETGMNLWDCSDSVHTWKRQAKSLLI